MWFTERGAHKIGRIDVDGGITEFMLPSSSPGPLGIASGGDGALWFTEQRGTASGASRLTATSPSTRCR